jgi:hypothetical protein
VCLTKFFISLITCLGLYVYGRSWPPMLAVILEVIVFCCVLAPIGAATTGSSLLSASRAGMLPWGLTRNQTTCPASVCWSLFAVKGVMKFQSLILMSVPHPTNKLHSCYEVTCNGRHCPNFDDPASTIRLDSHSSIHIPPVGCSGR